MRDLKICSVQTGYVEPGRKNETSAEPGLINFSFDSKSFDRKKRLNRLKELETSSRVFEAKSRCLYAHYVV